MNGAHSTTTLSCFWIVYTYIGHFLHQRWLDLLDAAAGKQLGQSSHPGQTPANDKCDHGQTRADVVLRRNATIVLIVVFAAHPDSKHHAAGKTECRCNKSKCIR
eukprot:TRINITY_DN8104_c0_g1_i4.p2 TRINITY_DN8104_c0_g1~~TRINITY_DN8104_c0_g1_i4.p2  ORF type:complete len:104 (-),score=8.39 TRINITY_DN8104_c0_g1_i4:802-1113(-)